MKTRLLYPGIALLLASMAPLAHALKTDRDQPMDIIADRVDVDDEKGISTFRGKVHVTRGSMRISGDVVVIHRNQNNDVETIVSTGKRAIYQQRPDNKPSDVVARGMTIHYDAKKEVVTVKKQAEINQAKDVFTGELLVYYAKVDQVKASGSNDNKNRVRMTLQPSNKKK